MTKTPPIETDWRLYDFINDSIKDSLREAGWKILDTRIGKPDFATNHGGDLNLSALVVDLAEKIQKFNNAQSVANHQSRIEWSELYVHTAKMRDHWQARAENNDEIVHGIRRLAQQFEDEGSHTTASRLRRILTRTTS